MSSEIITYEVYALGSYLGCFEAPSAEEAIQAATDEFGPVYAGESNGATIGYKAIEAD